MGQEWKRNGAGVEKEWFRNGKGWGRSGKGIGQEWIGMGQEWKRNGAGVERREPFRHGLPDRSSRDAHPAAPDFVDIFP
eukprot:jgi/Botrbrau1/3043/Bobra.0070s0039.1